MDRQLDRAPCGYVSLSDKGIIQSINQTLLDMLSLERGDLAGRHIETAMSVTNKLFFHTYFYPYIRLYGQVDEMYLSLRASGGEDIPVLLNGARQERGGEAFIDCVLVPMRKRIEYERDMLRTKTRLEELYRATYEANRELERLQAEYERKQRELLQVNERLEAMASTDPLTGLKNRRFFQDRLQAELDACRDSGRTFSLLLLDIDRFKRVNDTHGHPVGDLILTKLAELLRSLSREGDVIARFGGEEFVALLPGAGEAQAVLAAEAYRAAAAAATMDGYRITVSVGAATGLPEDTDRTLVRKADVALYASKSAGRNRATHAARLPRED
ncbi:diguanylate cyclase (GGDEF) domain-containing protein [Paenibacillus sp. UNC496MF]|uniref:sensor domain-containing diguanylate cyclase n=1 Tax=Paenibacillus sp. UNC496MF TaxID=1502753 RepID=UPI0008F29F5D|nr:sensor domain-containing diguanylate cyclase [Paenibacillus sp. UNC496MF]SFJ73652.1 diguanylate cyclase (GGDEF) domain-containing protein [Paenibacillus sp. UNC496MF]